MTDESDEEELSATLVARVLKLLPAPGFSATLSIGGGPFHVDLGWPQGEVEWRGAVGPLRWSAVGLFHLTFDERWMAISVSMSARVDLDLGMLKVSMNVTMGFSAHQVFSEPDERGSVTPTWTFSMHSRGGVSFEVAGVRFSSSWNIGFRGVSAFGPPLLAAAPAPLLLPFVRD